MSRGTSELTSTMVIISIAIATALAVTVYTNGLAGDRMQEHGTEVSSMINKNNEDIVIVHVEHNSNNGICNESLVAWIYNAGTIDTNITSVAIDNMDITPSSTLLPRQTISIICFDYSTPGEHTLNIECTYGNKDEYKVSI